MKKNTFLFILFFLPSFLMAQPYSLDECLEQAVNNNAVLKGMRIQEEVSAQLKKEAFTYYFPNVSALGLNFEAQEAMVNIDLGVLGSMSLLQDGMMGSVMALQPVFMGGKILYSNKLAKIGIRASELFTRQSTDQVKAQTEEYFWTLVTLYEKRKTVAIMQGVLDSLYKDVTSAQKAGVLGQNDVLKVKLQKNTLASQKVELENGIYLCRMALARQMGCRVDSLDGFDIQVPDQELAVNPNDLYIEPAQALASRTEYQLLDLQVNAAKMEKRIKRSDFMPQVAVGAAYYYETFMDKNNTNGALLAVVRVPISDWWRGAHAIRQKELLGQKAVIEREDGHQQLLMQIQQAWGAFVQAYEKWLLAQEAVEASEENARLNNEYFKAGTVSLTELLAAQGFLQVSYDDRVEAIKQYRISKSTYLQVTGR